MINKLFLVNKKVLILLCGIVWVLVATMLFRKTFLWNRNLSTITLIECYAIGFIIGCFKYFFMLKKFIMSNVSRIDSYMNKVSLFKFLTIKSYLLIILMILLGIFFRKSGLFSNLFLVTLYSGISTALFISGVKCFTIFFKQINVKY